MTRCNVDGCEGKLKGLGMCLKHYTRFKRYGNVHFVKAVRHGKSKTPEYKVWLGMKKRCTNPKHKRFHRYGGRGISICKRWEHSFLTFLFDMGLKPFEKAEIDRIDNDGNYEPGNCRWTTSKINNRNKGNVKLSFELSEEIRKLYKSGNYTQERLGEIYSVCHSTIGRIVRNKLWSSDEKATTT